MTKTKIEYTGKLHTECTHENGARIETDAPKDNGGKGELFSPTDLFAAALGSCILTIMALKGEKIGFDMTGATAEVEKEMVSQPYRFIGKLFVRVRIPKSAGDEQRAILEKAGLECPVHKSLHPDIEIDTKFNYPD